jgi:putative membrane protein
MLASDVHVHSTAAGGLGWWLPIAVVAVGYGTYAVGVARAQERLGRTWSGQRAASWALGVLLVAAAVSPPVAQAAHEGPRGHMVQHLLLGMYAPLALVLAAPVTLLLGAAPPRGRRVIGATLRSRPVHLLGHPLVAALLSTGGLYALYLTPLYVLTLEHGALHVLVNVHLLLAGALFAWAVGGPDPAPRRPGLGVRAGALLVSAAAHAYLAKLLYARADELPPGPAYPRAEVEQAAQWMYYGGDVAEVLLAVALFAAWYRRGGRAVPVRGWPGGHRHPGAGALPAARRVG